MSGEKRLTAKAFQELVMVTFLGMKIVLTPLQARQLAREIVRSADAAAAHSQEVPAWHA